MWCVVLRQVNLRLPEEMVEAIDRERGLVSRNAWIRGALSKGLGLWVPRLSPDAAAREVERLHPTPVVERSPRPAVDSGVSRGPSPAVGPESEGKPLSRAEMFARATQRQS